MLKGLAMNCSCIDMDVDCYADVISDTFPIARKETKCIECSRIIRKGGRYRNERTVFDGKWTTYRTCPDCNSIRETFICGGFYWGSLLDAMQESIKDCSGRISESDIMSLTTRAREQVCEMIERYWTWADEE